MEEQEVERAYIVHPWQMAEWLGVSQEHIMRAANNYMKGASPENWRELSTNRSFLPKGWGAVKWYSQVVLFEERFAQDVSDILRIPVTIVERTPVNGARSKGPAPIAR